MDEYKVKSGEILTARKYNRTVERVIASISGSGAGQFPVHRSEAVVTNSSGRDYGVGEILQLDGFDGPTANPPYEAMTNLVYDADQPTWHTAISMPCVAAEPIPNGEMGRVVLSGQCIIAVTNTATDDFVMVDASTTHKGKVSTGGFAKYLGRIDNDYVLCHLGWSSRLWRYKLTQDSQAPSTTTANLVDLDGTQFATSITLSDPLSVTTYSDTDDIGYCLQIGNAFQAIMPAPKTIQVLTDFIIDGTEITIERKNVLVLGEEDVIDEVIEGTDCSAS